ncbi:Alpha/Beta hydrolase protein [Colletotrichum navitas]|uniref:Alpha/Beta hydrolase protein n=1 Tax=Colletotrichum navitas TaxID=681940 RepID=A0AAD8V3S4_9PEZI|nr:Alpha/Beta hydrolase protein [Colletotrichum navitas]KAK1584964.1 Alpha/Beta hydrolase protein [Colletotrichum navitas]
MSTTQTLDSHVPVEPLSPPIVGRDGYTSLNPRSEVLSKGWKHPHKDARPLPCDIQIDHDVAITTRDGTVLYADVLRPPNTDEKVPAIICWSPFGKKFNGLSSLDYMTPWQAGVPSQTLSGLEKFEAPDPADWVPRGYAIVNVDTRGVFDSGGTMVILGSVEAEDGYDTGWAGWFIAALRPPSLKAIAPWEGCGDLYREQFARGGIYAGDLFDELIVKHMLKGRNGMESFREMFKQHPLANAWWNDKRPDMGKINVPTYITGTWTNTMHGMGAIRGWLEVDSADKWLRWHPWQEWYDLWGNPQAKEELFSFFDHFLKGIDNGWEKTLKVRMALGVEFEAGESVRVVLSGQSLAVNNFGKNHCLNKGRHIVHLGGQQASHVILPFV